MFIADYLKLNPTSGQLFLFRCVMQIRLSCFIEKGMDFGFAISV
jgi:hypothetical protein